MATTADDESASLLVARAGEGARLPRAASSVVADELAELAAAAPPVQPAAIAKRSWTNYAQGIFLLVVVSVLWTGASVVVQHIYETGYDKPFFLTYVCNAMFIGFLPLEFGRTWWRARHGAPTVRSNRDVMRAFRVAVLVCPAWFLAQGSYNWALTGTTISASTVLSTTSCIFTLGFSACFLRERVSLLKILGVFITIGGSVFVAYDPGSSGDGSIENTPFGIFLCLFSAVMYGVYTTEIRKFIPEDDPKFSMTLFFGFLGLCNSILLLPVILALHFTGTEDLSDTTAVIILWILLKGMFDNVLSDILWARAIVLTTPTVATVGLSLTIPLAMLSDWIFNRDVPSWQLAVGSVFVIGGFITVNVGSKPAEDATTTAAAASVSASANGANPATAAVADPRNPLAHSSPALHGMTTPFEFTLEDDAADGDEYFDGQAELARATLARQG